MKRDERLRGLSSEHHTALVIARRAPSEPAAWLRARFDGELAPHFAIEEELLLPPLVRAGATDLVDRTLEDHATLRLLVAAAERDDPTARTDFAERLTAHVRFEERELFPACEAHVPAEILAEVARRSVPTPSRSP